MGEEKEEKEEDWFGTEVHLEDCGNLDQVQVQGHG